MKKFTYSQIYKTFEKSIANEHRVKDMIDAIAEAPYYKTIVNLTLTFTIFDGCNELWFQIPVNILVKDVNIKRSVLMEIATQIQKFGELSYYKDEAPVLEFQDITIRYQGIYSFEQNKYAIFHEEQECGYAWLSIDTTNLTAPFTYQQDYSTKAIRRSETDAVEKHYVNRKR